MAAVLNPSALRDLVIQSIAMTADIALVMPAERPKPICMAIASGRDEQPGIFRIFAWNLTHGGATRSDDEFRIQLTGVLPDLVPGEATLVIGWSSSFGVFAGWDAVIHSGRTSSSPSLQVEREVLTRASAEGVGAAHRGSGDVVVAFRPELLTTYCLRSGELHSGAAAEVAADLNKIQVPDPMSYVQPISGAEREKVTRTFETNLRAWDFRNRVLGAYEQKCAICAQQLGLNEAAHIVPVAWPGSNDTTTNGLSLCRNHHRAYDSMLISVTGEYLVEVSQTEYQRLDRQGRGAGIETLVEFDGRELSVIPDAVEDRPNREYLELGRAARGWVG